jgi:hypothetical protein
MPGAGEGGFNFFGGHDLFTGLKSLLLSPYSSVSTPIFQGVEPLGSSILGSFSFT